MTGLKITLSVARIVHRGRKSAYYISFVTYSGSAVRAPSKRIFGISYRTHCVHGEPLTPKAAVANLEQLAQEEARRRGILSVINLF